METREDIFREFDLKIAKNDEAFMARQRIAMIINRIVAGVPNMGKRTSLLEYVEKRDSDKDNGYYKRGYKWIVNLLTHEGKIDSYEGEEWDLEPSELYNLIRGVVGDKLFVAIFLNDFAYERREKGLETTDIAYYPHRYYNLNTLHLIKLEEDFYKEVFELTGPVESNPFFDKKGYKFNCKKFLLGEDTWEVVKFLEKSSKLMRMTYGGNMDEESAKRKIPSIIATIKSEQIKNKTNEMFLDLEQSNVDSETILISIMDYMCGNYLPDWGPDHINALKSRLIEAIEY